MFLFQQGFVKKQDRQNSENHVQGPQQTGKTVRGTWKFKCDERLQYYLTETV